MMEYIESVILEKKNILDLLIECGYISCVKKACNEIVAAIKNGRKVLIAGNGGSAADAQHFASEIVGRFMMERDALPAISLCTDPSVMTCLANDYGYDNVFARQVSALGNTGDVFIGISTSGNSPNIINAIYAAKEKQIKTVALLGKDGGKIKEICDYALVVPSDCTPRIQEIHAFTVHILCEQIEKQIFGKTI